MSTSTNTAAPSVTYDPALAPSDDADLTYPPLVPVDDCDECGPTVGSVQRAERPTHKVRKVRAHLADEAA